MITNFINLFNVVAVQEATANTEIQAAVDAINADMGMLWMLLSGILVVFMQAGFTLVESGMTRSKNAVNIAMKNLLGVPFRRLSQ